MKYSSIAVRPSLGRSCDTGWWRALPHRAYTSAPSATAATTATARIATATVAPAFASVAAATTTVA